ncbi:MAG TPA: hypothetical protein VEI83_09105 [Acidimicrobiales bacterium]|nr:hypothetical protein [Acidimicrobiales bacterium]
MRCLRPWPRFVVGALTLATGGGALTGCSGHDAVSSVSSASSDSSAPPAITTPLQSALPMSSGSAAVVAMGTLDDPLNTFWQLFVRPDPTAPWTLATPPGVADNGGLVVSAAPGVGPSGAWSLLAGFEPSQALAFSPLSVSADGGATWAPGAVDGALALVPDALASSSSSRMLALLRARGGVVLHSAGDPTTWSTLVDQRALASSAAGRTCGVGALTAVALDSGGAPLVGSSCSTGNVVGVFALSGGEWQRRGPFLATGVAAAPTDVLRLAQVGDVTGVLVAVGGRVPGIVALAATADGAWGESGVLPLPAGTRLVSTAVEPGGGFVVLTSDHGSLALDEEAGAGTDFQARPAPPAGTQVALVGPGGELDALVVASTVCTDWRFDPSTGTWARAGSVTVPIQFGSSD